MIELITPELNKRMVTMVDLGAVPNVIKVGALREGIKLGKEDLLFFIGFTSHLTKALGKCFIEIDGDHAKFLLVGDNFPMKFDTVLE